MARRGGGIAGVRRCRGCKREGDVIAEDRCPQVAFLRDSFMITWLTGDYSRRNSPWSDERRTIAWARRKFTEISTWAGQAGCTGKDLYEESAAVFREAMKHSDE